MGFNTGKGVSWGLEQMLSDLGYYDNSYDYDNDTSYDNLNI